MLSAEKDAVSTLDLLSALTTQLAESQPARTSTQFPAPHFTAGKLRSTSACFEDLAYRNSIPVHQLLSGDAKNATESKTNAPAPIPVPLPVRPQHFENFSNELPRRRSLGYSADSTAFSYAADDSFDTRNSYSESSKKKKKIARTDRKCRLCGITETPQWRGGPDGTRTLCNACGLHYRKMKTVKYERFSLDSEFPKSPLAFDNNELKSKSLGYDLLEKGFRPPSDYAAARRANEPPRLPVFSRSDYVVKLPDLASMKVANDSQGGHSLSSTSLSSSAIFPSHSSAVSTPSPTPPSIAISTSMSTSNTSSSSNTSLSTSSATVTSRLSIMNLQNGICGD